MRKTEIRQMITWSEVVQKYFLKIGQVLTPQLALKKTDKMQIASIANKIVPNLLKWFGHAQ